jgi:hypothetical protein
VVASYLQRCTCIYFRTIVVGIGVSTWYFLHVKTLLVLVNLDVCVSAGCVKLVIFEQFFIWACLVEVEIFAMASRLEWILAGRSTWNNRTGVLVTCFDSTSGFFHYPVWVKQMAPSNPALAKILTSFKTYPTEQGLRRTVARQSGSCLHLTEMLRN